MSASSLLLRGQQKQAAHFPATIVVAGQTYTLAGISGLARQMEIGEFGSVASRGVSFTLPVSALDVASPTALEQQPLQCTSPANLAGFYTIGEVVLSPDGAVMTLRCKAPTQ